MGIKSFNRAAFLDFAPFLGLTGSNYDVHVSTILQTRLSQCYIMVKSILGLRASHEDVITQFGH